MAKLKNFRLIQAAILKNAF